MRNRSEIVAHLIVVFDAFNRLNENGMFNAADALLPQMREIESELAEIDFWK